MTERASGRRWRLPATAVAVSIFIGLSACSTASQQAASGSPSGTGAKPSISSPSQLKIAYFSAGSSNAYLQAGINAAKDTATKMGASLDVFDGQFDAQTQFNQMQTALTNGKYNAFAVEPNDGNLVCNMLTKQAPSKGVLVSIFNEPICGRATNLGDALYQPGTVTYVGGQTLDSYQQWIQQVITDNPNGGQVAVLTGPDLNANTLVMREAEKALKANPKFKIVAEQTTDYTTPQGFSAAQTILQSNPNLNIIMSNYSGISQGVVQAVNGTGRKGQVRIYDFGGDNWAVDAVKSGDLRQTVVMLPGQEATQAVQALADTVQGKSVPHFIDLTKSKELPGTPFVTASNATSFKPEY